MPDHKGPGVLNVSKGVARGHILCCCAVVFVCFMLTCLNLYMMSSTRSVLRHLDARLESHPRSLQRQLQLQQSSPEEAAAALMLQQQQQQQQGTDDFILLAPSDLDNAWTTQTGRLLVPVGQPEQDDDGWKQMQVQLAEQTSSQQRHIESLHDRLNDQYRAREELQRGQQDLMRQHNELERMHNRRMAKKERQLLKQKHRELQQGVQHEDQLRRFQSEMQQLKKVVEEVESLDPSPAAERPTSTPTPTTGVDAVVALLGQEKAPSDAVGSTGTVVAVAAPASAAADAAEVNGPLDHIFSAVFGPNPGSYFFPGYSTAAAAAATPADDPSASRTARGRRDLASDAKERRERRLARLESRLGSRHRRHERQEVGPLMRIDGGHLVPLASSPVVVPDDAVAGGARRRRLAAALRGVRAG